MNINEFRFFVEPDSKMKARVGAAFTNPDEEQRLIGLVGLGIISYECANEMYSKGGEADYNNPNWFDEIELMNHMAGLYR